MALVLVYLINFWQLQAPMNVVLKDDHRNGGIDISPHYSSYVNPSTS